MERKNINIKQHKFYPKIYESFTGGAECVPNAIESSFESKIKTCGGNDYDKTLTNITSSLVQYESIIESQKASATNLVRTLNGFLDAASSPSLITNINDMMKPLKEEKAKLEDEKRSLEDEAQVHNTIFEDEATDLSIPSPSLMTIQDWIISALMLSYLFAGLGLIGYIGYTTRWHKKSLLMTFLAVTVISVILYIILQSYA